jgi:hypothetical protein
MNSIDGECESLYLGVGGMGFSIGASEQGPGAMKQHTYGYRTG